MKGIGPRKRTVRTAKYGLGTEWTEKVTEIDLDLGIKSNAQIMISDAYNGPEVPLI